jgi:hypothetical protein
MIYMFIYSWLSGNEPNCATAFFAPEDWDVQRECQANNVRST